MAVKWKGDRVLTPPPRKSVDKSTIFAYFLTHGSAVRGVRAQYALALKIQIMKISPFIGRQVQVQLVDKLGSATISYPHSWLNLVYLNRPNSLAVLQRFPVGFAL